MHRSLILVLTVAAAACGPAPEGAASTRPDPRSAGAPPEVVERATREFEAVRDGFFEWYVDARPVRASVLGVHAHDGRLPRMDRISIQDRIDDVLDWSADLGRIPLAALEEEDRYDYAVLEFALRAELLELEEIRSWVKDPRLYTHPIARGLAVLAERGGASVGARVESLAGRMAAATELLEAARENLRSPPELWTRLAIADARGLRWYVEAGLVPALKGQGAGELPASFEAARRELIAALDSHVEWLEAELLPRSSGDFQLGRFLLQRKLLYEEHVSLTVEELHRLNQRAVEEYQERLAEVADEIDPDRSAVQILDSIAAAHPSPDSLLAVVRERVRSVRDWTLEADVVTLPDTALPVVRESPPYARGAFAYLDAAGPFAADPLPSFFYVTNVRPEWSDQEKEAYLAYFSDPAITGIALHETFPGHLVHAGVAQEADSRIRRLFLPRSLVEGWAHYAEEMALDEGYAADDPATRLVQLQRALLRHARWHAALRLHAAGAPLDEVVLEFMDIVPVSEAIARREVIRGTYDPMYLHYALGRMQIEELREDYQEHVEARDGTFSLREFHDRLLRLSLPLPLVRDALIPTRGRARPPR